ncbi:MAG: low specificity L-threonine aldolase [Eubacteriales bacterium]|nr:low specificity L-threonine aldolase [Eubacteriales bacterium]
MLSFESDYIKGAHPKVLEALVQTNMEVLPGYGSDSYCERAAQKIKDACGKPEAEVFFLVGGTQTNQTVISTMLENYEGVVAAQTGHVSTHEAGAIEYTGHKVLPLPEEHGKIKAADLQNLMELFYGDGNHEHMVFPGMVYISHPTEYGTLYSKAELQAIHTVCRNYDIPLFVDGARLGYGLASRNTDVTLKDLASLCDVFYIGGTKVGALCGEAVVFTGNRVPKHFLTQVKQHGALLAKGRLLGVQFDALFTDDLYMQISRHAIEMADQLKSIFREKGYRFYLESPTNQQFIILENGKMKELEELVRFSFWEAYDEHHTVVRFATSWSTTDEELEELKKIL